MPRYFFNIVVRGRKAISDPEGDDFVGDKEARSHAKTVVQDMLSNRLWYKRGIDRWAFEVTNGKGRQVAFVPFSLGIRKTKRVDAKIKKRR